MFTGGHHLSSAIKIYIYTNLPFQLQYLFKDNQHVTIKAFLFNLKIWAFDENLWVKGGIMGVNLLRNHYPEWKPFLPRIQTQKLGEPLASKAHVVPL